MTLLVAACGETTSNGSGDNRGGGAGTLSEIGFALKHERPVIGIGTFAVEGVTQVTSAAEAAELAVR